jgi:hypothetical protein
MLRCLIAAALLLTVNPAVALPVGARTDVKLGAGCVSSLSMLAPKLGTCTIAGAQMRIWCPNGQMFERTQDRPHQSLVRSLCNMPQVP